MVVNTSKDSVIQIDVSSDDDEAPDIRPKEFSKTLNARYAQNKHDFHSFTYYLENHLNFYIFLLETSAISSILSLN